MKIKKVKKLLAVALCVVLLVSDGVLALADNIVDAATVSSGDVISMEDMISEISTEETAETEETTEETQETAEETEEITEETEEAAEETEETTEEAVEETEETTEETEEAAEETEETTEETEETTEETEETTEETEETVEETEEAAEETEETTEETVKETEETAEETEEIAEEITFSYEDEEVYIELTATADVLLGVAGMNVTPIKEDDEATKDKYAEVAQQLNEKIAADNEANEEQKEIVGFLAYDITLVDEEGNELEPNGNVRVTMEYKEAAVPEAVAAAENVETTEVTVMHHVENAQGEVEEVVDMVAEENIEAAVEVTENKEVAKAEFVTDSFSVITLAWTDEASTYAMPGSYQLSMDDYKPTSKVYYMVVTSTPSVYGNQNVITNVTLNNTAVTNVNSTTPTSWTGGTTLSTYYPNLESGGTNTEKTLSITPAAGYYVTRVVVACCGQGDQSPFQCNTWNANNAYEKEFSVSNQGTVTTPLPSLAFGHSSESPRYCILISVAPIPSPLYVEYDFGEIGTLLGDAYASSVFANADAWTDDSASNTYKPANDSSDGGVKTNDTQFKYTYAVTDGMTDADKAAAVQSWSHLTNTITADAKAAAAAIGYYFDGWAYTYYNEVSVSTNTAGSYNNYTYTFSDIYGSGNVGENTNLSLPTDVRLVAQWKPIELKVTKEVTGLADTGFANTSNTYTIQVQKQNAASGEWENYREALNFTITGDGTQTQTLSTITPGTYRAVETAGNGNLSNATTVMYITVSDGETVIYDTADIQASREITVTNSYSPVAATYVKVVKEWKDESGNTITAGLPETLDVCVTDTTSTGIADTSQLSKSAALNQASGWEAIFQFNTAWSNSWTVEETLTGDAADQWVLDRAQSGWQAETVTETVYYTDSTKTVEAAGVTEYFSTFTCYVYKLVNVPATPEDVPYITVQKTFKGLTAEQVEELKDSFQITVTDKSDSAKTSTLTLNDGSVSAQGDDIVYTWVLQGYDAGTYTITESGESVIEYLTEIKINGATVNTYEVQENGASGEVTISAAEMTYTSTERQESCGTQIWEVGEVNLIVAKLTSNSGYFVWTPQAIGVSERLGIVDLINDQNAINFSPAAALSSCYFYSGDISNTFIFREGTITYDGVNNLYFTNTNQWAMFAAGNYTITDAVSAEIYFENAYQQVTTEIDLKKITTAGTEADGAEFALYKLIDDAWVVWPEAESTGEASSDVVSSIVVSNAEGEKELTGLTAGRYQLVETKAPDGCTLLSSSIYFTVAEGAVTLTDADGKELVAESPMWNLDAEQMVLTIKNTYVYTLPSTGGPGMYLYFLGGIAMMLGAAYIWFFNRRKALNRLYR